MKTVLLTSVVALILLSCGRIKDGTSGWDYNEPAQGGFQKIPFAEQETAPGMVLVGGMEGIVSFADETDTIRAHSFYLSRCEETNEQYCAYLSFLRAFYSHATYDAALPDTTVWEHLTLDPEEIQYRITSYLRGEEFRNHPVVGLTPQQIERYATWKSDRLNEFILIREGVLPYVQTQDSSQIFSTATYLNSQNQDVPGTLPDLNPDQKKRTIVRPEDGILLPVYRLPTSSEWLIACSVISLEGTVPETQDAGSITKYDKYNRFFFLQDRFDIYPHMRRSYEEPQAVTSGWTNGFGISGMQDNVRELVADSTGYSLLGGDHEQPLTFREPSTTDFSNDSKPVFRYPDSLQRTPQRGLYGFRFAMSRAGSPTSNDQSLPSEHSLKSNRHLVRMLAGSYEFSSNIMGNTRIVSTLKLDKRGRFLLSETLDNHTYTYTGNWKPLGNWLVCYPDQSDTLKKFRINSINGTINLGLMRPK